METMTRIVYTDAASKKLESALESLKLKIESEIAQENMVPGEEEVEVTASDIDRVIGRVRLESPKTTLERLNRVAALVSIAYGLFGLALILVVAPFLVLG